MIVFLKPFLIVACINPGSPPKFASTRSKPSSSTAMSHAIILASGIFWFNSDIYSFNFSQLGILNPITLALEDG